MRTLLIWEVISEETRLFLLDGEMAEIAAAAHGVYGNTDGGEAAERLSVEICNRGIASLDAALPVELAGPIKVVVSGFIL